MLGPLGVTEIVVISAIALLVFGPKRIPELAKSMGKGIRDFKKALEGGSNQEEKKELPPDASGQQGTIDVSSNPTNKSDQSDSGNK